MAPEDNLLSVAFLYSDTLMKLYSFPGTFSGKSEWLVNLPQGTLNHLFFPFSSQVYSLNNEEDDDIVIKEHYNIEEKQFIKTVGIWEKKEGLSLTEENIWERRKDLQGFQFLAETLKQPPYVEYDVIEDGTLDKLVGIVGDFWHDILEKSLNCSTKISLPPDGKWGNLEKDGSWSGLVSGLLENRYQIVITSLYKTVDRLQAIQFSEPFDKNTVRFFIKHPEREASWTTFLETFHFDVWMYVLLLVILMMVCLYITYIFKQSRMMEEESFNLSNTPLVVWETLLGQGPFAEPKEKHH